MLRKSSLIACAILAVSVASAANAAVVFSNAINDTNPSATNPFTTGQTVVSNLTASGIGRGTGITANAGGNRYNAAGWTTAAAIDANDYFTWTLTPASNFELDLNTLSLTPQSSSTGAGTIVLRSSLDNFASNIGSPVAVAKSGAADSLKNFTLGAAFQNLTSAVTFRLYAYSAGSATGTTSINDFSFDGAVSAVSSTPPTITLTTPGSAGGISVEGSSAGNYGAPAIFDTNDTASGTVPITFDPANPGTVLVAVDFTGTPNSTALAALNGIANFTSSVNPVFGAGYDGMFSFTGQTAASFNFNYNFASSGLTLANIAAIPEPSAIAFAAPAALLLSRRRK